MARGGALSCTIAGIPSSPVEPHDRGAIELLVSAADGVRIVPLTLGTEPVIGRTSEADIVVADASISRRHARLHLGKGPQLVLEDLGSRNGTTVNGRPVPKRGSVPLDLGIAFQLASATFLVQKARRRTAPRRPERSPNVLDLVGADSLPAPAHVPQGMIVVAPMMLRLYSVLDVIAPTGLSVLILGETGVGKEGIAEAVHLASARAGEKFLKLNCAALPESLLEAELFGYEKGAFTGASAAKPGLFEAADHGTVFLDEIGEIGLSTQAKLLRVLECGEVLRMGSVVPKKIDVRYVAATNRDLKQLVAGAQFRADLFFRLNGVSLEVPPLRQRREEIAPLAEHFAAIAAARLGRPQPVFDPEAIPALVAYPWPGNVRELRNVIDRAVALSAGQPITAARFLLEVGSGGAQTGSDDRTNPVHPAHTLQSLSSAYPRAEASAPGPLPAAPPAPPAGVRDAGEGVDFKSELRALERERMAQALERHGGNQTQAAKDLQISRHTLMQRMELYGLVRPRKKKR